MRGSRLGATSPPPVGGGTCGVRDRGAAFGPTEQGIMLEMSELDRFGAIWIDSDTFEKF